MLRTDDIDEKIIALLREDGRLSNREVARRLDISEGTVRQRLKKLEEARAIRIGAVVDPAKLGIGVAATVLAAIEPGALDSALATFAALPATTYVASITGAYNLYVLLTARDMVELRELITTQIESFRGVLRVDVRVLVRTPKHEYHVVAITPG